MEYSIVTCENCGKSFEGVFHFNRRLCDECRALSAKNAKMRLQQERKSVTAKTKRKRSKPKTLDEILREIEKYNATHDKQITYGQYVARMERM